MRTLLQRLLLLALAINLNLISIPLTAIAAEEAAKKQDINPTQQTILRVPQTPEELLIAIKELFANPDIDGHDFCELWLGLDRVNWKENSAWGQKESKYMVDGGVKFPPAPYELKSVYLNRQYKVHELNIHFFKNPSFLMTPAVVREVLGVPTELGVTNPTDREYSSGKYRLVYCYYKKNKKKPYGREKYMLWITFMDRKELPRNKETKKLRREYRKHTPEQIASEQARRSLYENHKDYLPVFLELRR